MLGEHFPVRSQGVWDVKRKEDVVPVHPGVLGATWGKRRASHMLRWPLMVSRGCMSRDSAFVLRFWDLVISSFFLYHAPEKK